MPASIASVVCKAAQRVGADQLGAGAIADAAHPMVEPLAAVREQAREWRLALRQSDLERAKHGRDLEDAPSRQGLAQRDPQQVTAVIHVARLAAKDLAGAHAHEERHHRRDCAVVPAFARRIRSAESSRRSFCPHRGQNQHPARSSCRVRDLLTDSSRGSRRIVARDCLGDDAGMSCDTATVIERVLRTATGFTEAAELDRQDIARMTFEERISEVEKLRRIWFGEDRAESRLDRVLECADLVDDTTMAGREGGGTAGLAKVCGQR
jgi:hypothetical protein